jgi:hypothetical protein
VREELSKESIIFYNNQKKDPVFQEKIHIIPGVLLKKKGVLVYVTGCPC